MTDLVNVSLISIIALVVNIPLGCWRHRVRKFSLSWFIAVHLSVPLIIYLRLKTGVPMVWVPVTIGFAIVGQLFWQLYIKTGRKGE